MAKLLGSLFAWLDERLGLAPVKELVAHKTVPVHRHSIWYFLGGFTLFLFCIQVATGLLLLMYYRPSEAEAWESVQYIMTEVSFGWLIRSVHGWSADLMIGALYAHLFSVLLMQAYRPPRDLTWYSGVLLFVLAIGFGFTGYLLPWTKLAYFATAVGSDSAGAVPLVGDFLKTLLRGGEDISGATLTRMFGGGSLKSGEGISISPPPRLLNIALYARLIGINAL